MSFRFRHAICNEVYKDWPFDKACHSMREIGYEGIEIAPFTLAEDPSTITTEQRRGFQRAIEDAGLSYVGLHWVMASPKGLHVTTPDKDLRTKSWLHIRNLVDLSADLGNGGVLVFGSPQQRGTTGGLSREEATRNFMDGLATVVRRAEERGVTILIEAMPRNQCDVILSLEESARLAREFNSPAVATMFDVHNAVDETTPHDTLIEKYFTQIRHVHVNENDGRHPGTGDYDFKPVFRALVRCGYEGWVSLEAFDFTPGAETIARESLRHLENEISQINS